MNNSHSSGDTWQVPAPIAVKSGVPFVIGSVLCVPVTDAAIGELVAVQVTRAFTLPKLGAAVIGAGDKLHWDTSAGHFIVTGAASGDLEGCAVAVNAAAAGTTSVVALLVPGLGVINDA